MTDEDRNDPGSPEACRNKGNHISGPSAPSNVVLMLVDTTTYGVPGLTWCRYLRRAPGSAAVYPVKVQVPGRGEGQYKDAEIVATKDPALPRSTPLRSIVRWLLKIT